MNKLFTKIATAFVGMAMAVGVGVAVGVNNAKGVSASTSNFTLSSASSVTQDGITVTFNKSSGSNAPAWYAAGLRLYASNTIEITSSNSITGVSFNWEKQGSKAFATVTADVGSYSHPTTTGTGTWSGSANTVVFTLGSSGQLQLNTFSVDYSGSGPVVSYTITYDANGGSGSMDASTGTNPAVAACTFTAPSGKQFLKWNTAANGSGTDYAVGATPKADLSLYAIWEDAPNSAKLVATSTGDFVSPWSADPTPGNIETTGLTRGWQWSGGNSATITYSTDKSIEKVVISATTNGSGSVSVTVGGEDFGESQTLTSTKTEYTFEGSETGNVVISLTNSGTKSVYADSIEVFFADESIETSLFDSLNEEGPFEVIVGDTISIFYKDISVSPYTNIEDAIWVSSDPTVFAESGVSADNYYFHGRGLKVGQVTLTASKAGYKVAQAIVNVIEDPSLPEVVIWDNTWIVNPGDGYKYSSTPDLHVFYLWLKGDDEKEFDDRTYVEADSWASSDETVATIKRTSGGAGAITTLKTGTTTLTATVSGYKTASVQISVVPGSLDGIQVSGLMTKVSYTTAESWDPSGLVVKKVYNSGWEEVITSGISWSYSPSAPAKDVTSVVATATWNDGEDDWVASSAAQAVTVTVQHAGTADDPFTVAEALAKANEIGTVGNTGQGPWVTTGIISRVTSAPAATYWNATYFISDDGSQTNELQVYRGFYLDNAKFDDTTKLLMKAGMVVTITGNLTGSYGCEYCQGNYLLDIHEQETGDVDVAFDNPDTSVYVGDTGTYVATSETAGAEFTFESSNTSVLTVDASTGAYEAKALGIARVTVTASAGGKEGSTYVDVSVNGWEPITVNAANDIAESLESGATTPYTVKVEGYVSEFDSDGASRALKITNMAETEDIVVFVGKSGYSTFIDGLALGTCIRVVANVQNYGGTYELQNPVKDYTEYVFMTFSEEFISLTDAICKDYDGVTSNKEALEAIWGGLETKYDAMSDVQHNILADPTTYGAGQTTKDAMARYDYLVGKYELDNFIIGRTPVLFSGQPTSITSGAIISNNNAMIVVTVIALTSVSAIAVLLVIKRRKTY